MSGIILFNEEHILRIECVYYLGGLRRFRRAAYAVCFSTFLWNRIRAVSNALLYLILHHINP